jgi:site-specific DNA recombinase
LDLADLALRIKELRLKHEQLYAQKVMVENELSEKKVELIDMKTMTKYALEMQQIVREGTLVHKRTFIKGFIKEITVTGKKAVMKYSLPNLPESVELDLEGVPRTVQYGGR